jgi:hypothetical protein
MEFTMPANGMRDITITDKDMGGKATFISKENKPLTPRGTCSNLSTTKDYVITFKNLNIGTECHCEMAKKIKPAS